MGAMGINISCGETGGQKTIDVEDEKILRNFYDQRIAAEVDGDAMGEDFAGYVFRITGGNGKQGERKRRSVRGCIVGPDLSIVNLTVVKVGDKEIEGLTDDASIRPLRLGPKRASRVRKFLELERGDDVRKAVNMIRRKTTYTNKKGKEIKIDKAPKIQRLVTPLTLQRKRRRAQRKSDARAKALSEAAAFQQLSTQRLKERRASEKARRSSRKRSRISKA